MDWMFENSRFEKLLNSSNM